MSTLVGSVSQTPLKSEEDLLGYFLLHAKKQDRVRVGLEAEFPVVTENGEALAYEGAGGVESILCEMAARFGYEKILEEGKIIALKRGDLMITLEPGGQMELSAPPVRSVFEIENQIEVFREELRILSKLFPGTRWLGYGIQPLTKANEIVQVPKRRYHLMAEYLQRKGSLALAMMNLTATNQVNFDYWSEEHALGNLRTAFAIAPVVSAMFANSPFSGGAANGYLSYRQHIWRHTDPDRSGILWQFLENGKTFRDYLEYLLNMPMIFIVRDGSWIPVQGLRFREFLKHGYQGTRATLGDFELHLSTAFPEARLKQYLEIRGTDAQSLDLVPAVAAFWKGILYDEKVRDQAWQKVASARPSEREKLWEEVPSLGLRARLGNQSLLEIAQDLVSLSCLSLGRQVAVPGEPSECLFLNRIQAQIIDPGKSPADLLLEKWNGEWNQSVRLLLH